MANIKKYDLKYALEKQMPSLIRLIDQSNISWSRINSGLEKHLDKIKEEIKNTSLSHVTKDATFYSFLIGNFKLNKETAPMFDFFETTFSQLYERLSKNELIHLHKIIKLVLSNFDYRYLNFIGELAILNAYKSTGQYELLNIEERIYENKDIKSDLFIKRISDDKKILVEIVNIHLENRDLNNLFKIKQHIEDKIQLKINKTFFEHPKYPLYIQPVIWFENIQQIEIVSEIFLKNLVSFDSTFVPMGYLTYQLANGLYEHRFEYVTTILID